jgi:hypothetical protein
LLIFSFLLLDSMFGQISFIRLYHKFQFQFTKQRNNFEAMLSDNVVKGLVKGHAINEKKV